MNQGVANDGWDKNFESWFQRHYLKIFLILLGFFTFLPILAPTFMKLGLTIPAKIIYWVYSFFCHQLPHRSFFFFGAQPFYPLKRAGVEGFLTFEAVFGIDTGDPHRLQSIIGNSFLGYKTALCQRDLAIYFSLFLFGIMFSLTKRRIKTIPIWVWIIFGVLPLGFDGMLQVISNSQLAIINGLLWESSPAIRMSTGALFGSFTGWYIFPALELLVNKKN